MEFELVYRQEPGIIFDCIKLASLKLNKKSRWISNVVIGRKPEQDEQDLNYLNYWLDQFAVPNPELLVFFYTSTRVATANFITTLFDANMESEYGEVEFNQFMAYFQNPNIVKRDLMKHYLGSIHTLNEREIEQAIRQNQDLPENIKYYLLGFTINTETYVMSLIDCLYQYFEQLKGIYRNKSAEILQWMETMSREKLIKVVEIFCPQKLEKMRNQNSINVMYSLTLIMTNLIYFDVDYDKKWFLIGYNFTDIMETELEFKLELESFGSAIGDKHRAAIIQIILQEGQQTSGDIAKKLGMAINTVSYHLDIMKKANILVQNTIRKSTYYWINARTFQLAAQLLEQIAAGDEKNEQVLKMTSHRHIEKD